MLCNALIKKDFIPAEKHGKLENMKKLGLIDDEDFNNYEKLIVKQIGQVYKKPVYLTAPKNQSDTLFVIEQSGRIQTIVHGRTVAPLLDIRERVHKPKQSEVKVV